MMKSKVKKSLGIAEEVTINDDLISSLMTDCEEDLKRSGVKIPDLATEKEFLLSAYVSYCNAYLNNDVNKQRIFKEIYNDRKVELSVNKRR